MCSPQAWHSITTPAPAGVHGSAALYGHRPHPKCRTARPESCSPHPNTQPAPDSQHKPACRPQLRAGLRRSPGRTDPGPSPDTLHVPATPESPVAATPAQHSQRDLRTKHLERPRSVLSDPLIRRRTPRATVIAAPMIVSRSPHRSRPPIATQRPHPLLRLATIRMRHRPRSDRRLRRLPSQRPDRLHEPVDRRRKVIGLRQAAHRIETHLLVQFGGASGPGFDGLICDGHRGPDVRHRCYDASCGHRGHWSPPVMRCTDAAIRSRLVCARSPDPALGSGGGSS